MYMHDYLSFFLNLVSKGNLNKIISSSLARITKKFDNVYVLCIVLTHTHARTYIYMCKNRNLEKD